MTDGKSKDVELEKKVDGEKVKKLFKKALFMGVDNEGEKKLMEGWIDKIFSNPAEKKNSKS